MQLSSVQSLKLAIASAVGLSKDALHVYVGLTVLFASAILMRKPVRSILPWLATLAVAVAIELLDMRDDILSLGRWRWKASLHDVLNTIFWPSVLLVLARLGLFFKTPDDRN
jgi:hypothetical protein